MQDDSSDPMASAQSAIDRYCESIDRGWPKARCEDGRIVLDHGDCCEVFPNLDDMGADPIYRMDQSIEWIYIYALADPLDGIVRYIGKSIRPKGRLVDHCRETSPCHRTNWIQSIIAQGRRPVLGILDRLRPGGDWEEAERRWIRYAREVGWNLVNQAEGGQGHTDMPPEVRAKIGNANRGLKRSEEVRSKSAARLAQFRGRKHTEESKRKISEAAKKRVHTEAKGRALSDGIRKVTDDQVAEVLRRIAGGESHSVISKAVGISMTTISHIRDGKLLYCRKNTTEEHQ